MTYSLRLRPPERITIHAGRPSADGAQTACGLTLPLVGVGAVHLEPDLDTTCRACRDTIHHAEERHDV